MLRYWCEVEIAGGLGGIPWLPDDDALTIGADGGDQVGCGGDGGEGTLGAGVTGDEKIVEAEAGDAGVGAGEKKTVAADVRHKASGDSAAAAIVLGNFFEC